VIARLPVGQVPTTWQQLKAQAKAVYLGGWQLRASSAERGAGFCLERMSVSGQRLRMDRPLCESAADIAWMSPSNRPPRPGKEQVWVATRLVDGAERMWVAAVDECKGQPCKAAPGSVLVENLVCTWLARASAHLPADHRSCLQDQDCALLAMPQGATPVSLAHAAAAPYRSVAAKFPCVDSSLALMGQPAGPPKRYQARCKAQTCVAIEGP